MFRRQRLQEELLKDPYVGDILAGFASRLLLVASYVRASLLSQPILTIHDLEMHILSHPMFKGKRSFEEARLGKLQFHPLVKHHFGLNDLPSIPQSFPAIGGMEILQYFFSADVLSTLVHGTRLSGARARSAFGALSKIADAYHFDNFRELGIAVQDGSFLGQIIPAMVYSKHALERDLRAGDGHMKQLAKLSSKEKQQELVSSASSLAGITSTRPDWPSGNDQIKLADRVTNYARWLFAELLQLAKAEETPGDQEEAGEVDLSEVLAEAPKSKHEADERGEAEDMEAKLSKRLLRSLREILREPNLELGGLLEAPPVAASSKPWLGHFEDRMCKEEQKKDWNDMKLGTFGSWLAQNSDQIANSAGLVSRSREQLDVEKAAQDMCRRIRADGGNQKAADDPTLVLHVLQQYYAGVLTNSELQAIVDNVGDVEIEAKPEGDSTDVVLQASSSHVSLPAAQQVAMSEERDRLLESATEAVLSCPLLFDVVESLPEWETNFGALAMDVSSFLRSPEFQSRARKRGAVACVLEVRHSVFLRLPSAEDSSTERLAEALGAVDGRCVAAIVLARILREGTAAPLSLLKEQVSKGYRAFVETQPEHFLLTAIAALPRGIASKEVVEIIASGYMRLERPPVALLNLVFGVYEGVPSFRSALKRLGLHFGIMEWADPSRPENDQAAGSRAAATAAATAAAATAAAAGTTVEAKDAGTQSYPVTEQPSTLKESAVQLAAEEEDAENEEVCRRIAAMKKVDYEFVDLEKREWIKEPEDAGVRSLQQTVQGAVKRLSEDLYSGEAHFLLELLQNCDDCTYPEGETPTLRLTYEPRKDKFKELSSFRVGDAVEAFLVVEHNERGFQEKNVIAICDIDKSTKQATDKKFMGAKGIGFKSVFLVTATPVLHSRGFHFHFDAEAMQGLGSLLPFPLKPASKPPRGTRLVLPLSSISGPLRKRGLRAPDVGKRALKDVQPTLLLFLRKVARVEAFDGDSGLQRVISKMRLPSEGQTNAEEINLKADEVNTWSPEESPKSEEQRWLIQTRGVEVQGDVESGSSVTELKLAFRLDANAGSTEKVYAWLPLQSYGLRFVVQADWKVPSSREAITDNVFNQQIREQVPAAFVEAAEAFRTRAAAAALEHSIVLRSCDEDAGYDGLPLSQLRAALDASADALQPLYTAVPRTGDAVNFFQGTDAGILRALRNVPIMLVRVPGSGPGPDDANLPPCEEDVEEAEQDERHFRLGFSTAKHAVRERLPEGIPASLSEHLPTLEPLLAQAGHYLEVGKLPARVAEALGVPVLDADVALDCLKAFASRAAERDDADMPIALGTSDIETLHLLLLIVEAKPEFLEEVRHLAVVPTEAGLVALAEQEASGSKVYDIPDELAGLEAVLGEGQRLDPRLGHIAHPKVKQLLLKLGVERVDGLAFFDNVLLPVLAQGVAPDAEQLLAVTRRFKQLVAICEDEGFKEMMAGRVRETGWWAVASSHTCESQMVKVGGQSGQGLHLTSLSKSLASALRLADGASETEWLTPSEQYFEKEEAANSEEREKWEDFWTFLGAVPAFHMEIDFKDVASAELERLLQIVGKDAKLAEEVVKLLAPHGEFYKDPRKRRERGGHLLWGTCSATLLGCRHMTKRFAFLPCVSTLAEAWPDLGIEQSPSAETIISLLRGLHTTQEYLRLRTSEMMTIYAKLQEKPAQRSAATVSAFIGQDGDLEAFLNEEPWVFIPNHPKPHGGFKDWYEVRAQDPRRGSFYRVKQLVFQDRAECLDGFNQNAGDDVIDLMRERLDKRVVANYYFGDKTLFPTTWARKPPQNRFLSLLAARRVQDMLCVEDYIAVLEAVDEQISVITSKKGSPKISLESIPGLMIQILRRVHIVVDTELREARHRQEEVEEEQEEKQDSRLATDMAMSNSLATFCRATSGLRFLKAADGSWQPMKHFAYVAAERKRNEFSGWSAGALQYVAIAPEIKGRRTNFTPTIIKLLQRCGIRPWDEKEETLRRCAAIVSCEEVLKEQRRAVTMQILSEAIQIAEEMYSDVKGEENMLDGIDIFGRLRSLAGRLRVEPASAISVHQAIVLDIRESQIRGREASEMDETSIQFAEFKSHKGAGVPIVRTKQLEETTIAFTGEAPAGSGDEEKQIVFTFQGGVVEALEQGSQSLSRALAMVATQGSPGELPKDGYEGRRGLSELASIVANLLTMAIEAAAGQCQDQPSESFPETSSESIGTEGVSESEENPSARRLFDKLFEEFKDMEKSDMWEALAHASDEDQGSGVESDLSTADLLQNAYEALHFRRKKRAKKTQAQAPEKSARRDKELGECPPSLDELLAPMLPYDATRSDGSNLPFDVPGGRSEQADRPQEADDGRRSEVLPEANPGDVAQSIRAKQVGRLRDGEADRPSRRERGLSHPRGYSLKRIALDLDAPPLETGTFGDTDVRPEDLQEVLAKASTPSSGSGAGSSAGGLEWVGKVGELLAKRSLEQQGFEVCWVNETGELGLPFDLILSQGGSLPTLRSDGGSVQGELAAELLDAALRGEGDPNVCFAEVKSTTSGDREVFEISRAEVTALSTLGPRYWLARVFGVPDTNPKSGKAADQAAQNTKVRLWKDPKKALQSGDMKLLLLT
ncbi:hypothetical protein AK812_SmicGene39802 [Symbiodinium microadriaticum]|uniref:Uncharacterized protein n=1 Tax=Symbiodinium microadriaticum TaxID=2951 RepID=A0A1Q9CAB4_SYMMI|nr:hypothetical protein AK812_SmicGene39802 [Symbiodinium microadriaticum]